MDDETEQRYAPVRDGVDHVNIYSQGRTPLGRFLSNFTYCPFNTKQHGAFDTLEGYWQWLKTGMLDDEYRILNGAACKHKSKNRPRVPLKDFDSFIASAVEMKIKTAYRWLHVFLECELPFAHYYAYGPKAVFSPSSDKFAAMVQDIHGKMREYYTSRRYDVFVTNAKLVTYRDRLDELLASADCWIGSVTVDAAESVPCVVRDYFQELGVKVSTGQPPQSLDKQISLVTIPNVPNLQSVSTVLTGVRIDPHPSSTSHT